MARTPSWQRKVAVCKRGHQLQVVIPKRDGWACEGRLELGGCVSGITDYYQSDALPVRFECRLCDYDLCQGCFDRVAQLESRRFAPPEPEAIYGEVYEQDVLAAGVRQAAASQAATVEGTAKTSSGGGEPEEPPSKRQRVVELPPSGWLASTPAVSSTAQRAASAAAGPLTERATPSAAGPAAPFTAEPTTPSGTAAFSSAGTTLLAALSRAASAGGPTCPSAVEPGAPRVPEQAAEPPTAAPSALLAETLESSNAAEPAAGPDMPQNGALSAMVPGARATTARTATRRAATCGAKPAVLSLAPPGCAATFGGVPIVDPARHDSLLEALSGCGAVFVRAQPLSAGEALPDADFASWHGLWEEAMMAPSMFWSRPALRTKLLKYSKGEDLARTLHGAAKQHTPDVRYNFGTGTAFLQASAEAWGDLGWIQERFWQLFQWTQGLVRRELAPLSTEEPAGTLGAKVRDGWESWAGTNLRHSVYPAGGSCTEHTDYGVVTVQQSTADGLEGFVFGEWRPLQPPQGCVLVFAGDMLERLTAGGVPALRHRVCLPRPEQGAAQRGAPAARQSHILFLQPDKNTIVKPLCGYSRGDGTDPPPIRYRDWHRMKAGLAFRWD